jgi:hypothetical protein
MADAVAVLFPIDALSQQETSTDAALSGPAGRSVLSASEGQPVDFFIRQTAEFDPEPTFQPVMFCQVAARETVRCASLETVSEMFNERSTEHACQRCDDRKSGRHSIASPWQRTETS